MPVVTFHNEHKTFEVEAGANLREFMLKVGVPPYKPIDRALNCRGHNLCGTCCVEIVGNQGASQRGQDEEATLRGNFAIARKIEADSRLACQTLIMNDMTVKTHPSFPIDWPETKQRLSATGIATFFLLAFLFMFAVMFFDMIKLY